MIAEQRAPVTTDAASSAEPTREPHAFGRHFGPEQLERLERLAGVGIWEWSISTGAVTWSPAVYRLLGLDQATTPSYEAFVERLHPDDRAWIEREVAAVAADGHPLSYEARIIRPDGQVRWMATHAEVATDPDGSAFLTGTLHDVTERKVAQLELARRATTDALTGLANRAVLADRLDHALAASHRTGEPVALLLVDLDAFKPVNDIHGHPVGDRVLVHIAGRLQDCVRPGDTLARVSGDEFAMILAGADVHEARAVADRLVDHAAGPLAIDGIGEVALSASVGIAVSTTPPHGAGELRREADLALYTAKRNGRGQHAVFTPMAHEATTDCLMVDPRDARAWASYLRALRAEIAAAKHRGALPEKSRAPEPVQRTFQSLLAAIDALPHHTDAAPLALPDRAALEEFVFHHALVQHWADDLMRQSVFGTRRSLSAVRFWKQLYRLATTSQ